MIGSALALSLMLASAPANAAGLGAAIENLRAAEAQVNEDPEKGVGRLEVALKEFHDFGPAAAGSPSALEARIYAQLTLARAYLALDDRVSAHRAMDEALRISRGDPLPVDAFGPSSVKLHDERRAALEEGGRGDLLLQCSIACRVYLDERKVDPHVRGLFMGRYRLWVEAENPELARPWRTTVTVVTPGETITLDYPGRAVAPTEASAEPEPAPEPGRSKRSRPKRERVKLRDRLDPGGRIMPRWAEVATLAVGVGGTVAGGVLLGLDGRCAGEDKNPDTCPDLWEFTIAGATTTAVSAAILITGATLLGIDEARAKKRAKAAIRVRPSSGGLTIEF